MAPGTSKQSSGHATFGRVLWDNRLLSHDSGLSPLSGVLPNHETKFCLNFDLPVSVFFVLMAINVALVGTVCRYGPDPSAKGDDSREGASDHVEPYRRR